MTSEEPQPARDAAWVVLDTPLPAAELAAFCRQTEKLYRINPFLEIRAWQPSGDGRFRALLLNHSNDQQVDIDAWVSTESEHTWRIDFAAGAKRSTRFAIEPLPSGSRLTITDEYRVDGGAVPTTAEIDRSLHAWGVAIKTYIERDRRWGWLPLYRFYMRRVWVPMTPAARRIMFLVLVIAVADIALVALGIAVYWLESQR